MRRQHDAEQLSDGATTMRAAVVDKYGPPEVARIAEVPRPRPGNDELLVRVHATPVTSGDARIRGARFPAGFGPVVRLAFGITGPRRRVLGGTFAGVVEVVGDRVEGRAVGEPVCGMTGVRMGAHAEFVVVRADRVASVPAGVSLDDAAGVLFGGTTALFFLRDKAAVAPGMSVLVNGASGAVGTNAVQLAKHFGANVTAVTSAANAGLVTSLGADQVVDYALTDITTTSERYDVVIDCVGNIGLRPGRRLLTKRGMLVLVVASIWDTLRARRNVAAGSSSERPADFEVLLGLVADGTLEVVYDRSFDLADIVDAYRCVDGGHKRGNVLVHPGPSPQAPAS